MATPPISGAPLRALAWLARRRPGAWLITTVAARDFRIRELLAMGLPAPEDTSTRPWSAAAPRTWADQGLPAPARPRSSAAALRAAYASGADSPEAVLARSLARTQAGHFGHATHSPYVVLTADLARAAAADSARRWREGRPLGPLDGVPIALKDELDIAGLPTRMGTAYRDAPVSTDAFVVRRLQAAGAVITGKTHLPEIGATPMGTNPHHDLPRCTYHPDRAAGGSSTGSSVAVSLGLVPLAIGSDAGGSIRIPAAINGIFGLKPTLGRIGRTGNPLALKSLPHLGPLGATTGDLVDLLSVIATTPDPDDAPTGDVPDLGQAEAGWRAALGRGVRGARIAVPEGEWADADPRIAALGRDALAALERDGAVLVPAHLPLTPYGLSFLAMELLVEGAETLGVELRENEHRLGHDLLLSNLLGDHIPEEIFEMARRGRAALRREAADVLRGVDLIALPTLPRLPPAYPRKAGRLAVSDLATIQQLCRYACLANLTGIPAGSAPVGLVDGLPVGLQLVGDAWDEASVLAGLAHVERLGLASLPPPPGYASLLG